MYKKGELSTPANFRTVCMLSCVRKIVETALADQISRNIDVNSSQFGFQKGLSPTMSRLDVDAIVVEGRNKVTTSDLSKAWDRVSREILIVDCREF